MSHKARSRDSFLYSNVRIRSVEPVPAAGALIVRAAYAEREEQKILYEGVLYSQLDKSAEGERIALAAELRPDEYRDAKHQASAMRFRRDCKLQNLDPLEEIIRSGYRLFMHYAGQRDEYIVIAKRLRI